MRTDTVVSHLEFGRGKLARGVACVDRGTGRSFELAAPLIVLCASTIETVRILLASERVRDSEVLGRYLMDHVFLNLSGTAPVRGRARRTSAVRTGSTSRGFATCSANSCIHELGGARMGDDRR